MDQNELTSAVKRAVLEFDPEAEIVLYGSRARGDAQPDSDWDFLIVMSFKPDAALKEELYRRLSEIEWDVDEVITASLRTRDEWNQPLSKASPFHQNVSAEGILI